MKHGCATPDSGRFACTTRRAAGEGHADLTRTVSGASDAEPDGIKHIEPIDRIPARESKEQCEKLQVAPPPPPLVRSPRINNVSEIPAGKT